MKKINKSFLYKFSSLCIALGGFIFYHGPCMLLFGEPDFKEKEKPKDHKRNIPCFNCGLSI